MAGLAARLDPDATAVAASAAAEASAATAGEQRSALGAAAPDDDTVDGFGAKAGRPAYTLLAGFLGGVVTSKTPTSQLLFLDAKLATWMLIPIDEIQLHDRVKDDNAPFGERDVLWVNRDARVARGDESEAPERTYLNGPFTRAGDIAAPATTSTFSGNSGLLCEAVTPGCCTRKSY